MLIEPQLLLSNMKNVVHTSACTSVIKSHLCQIRKRVPTYLKLISKQSDY